MEGSRPERGNSDGGSPYRPRLLRRPLSDPSHGGVLSGRGIFGPHHIGPGRSPGEGAGGRGSKDPLSSWTRCRRSLPLPWVTPTPPSRPVDPEIGNLKPTKTLPPVELLLALQFFRTSCRLFSLRFLVRDSARTFHIRANMPDYSVRNRSCEVFLFFKLYLFKVICVKIFLWHSSC